MRGAPTLLVSLVLCVPPMALCAARVGGEAAPHFRPSGRFCESLLRDAVQRSPTVRRMISEIDLTSGLVVYLKVSPWTTASATRLIGAAGDWRYVMVTLSLRKPHDELVVRLGHELEHVLEIAHAPEVRDQQSLRALFERIGRGNRATGNFETQAALDVGQQIRKELATHPVPAPTHKVTAAPGEVETE